jgi:hypothetical protein
MAIAIAFALVAAGAGATFRVTFWGVVRSTATYGDLEAH